MLRGSDSTSLKIVAPVVEKPLTLSKMASAKCGIARLHHSGSAPNTLPQIHASATMTKVPRVERRISVFRPAIKMTIAAIQLAIIGTAKEEIPCRYAGEHITIALNYVYVEEPMKVIDTEYITFEFSEAMKAITMRPEPAQDFFHIIMPMQAE